MPAKNQTRQIQNMIRQIRNTIDLNKEPARIISVQSSHSNEGRTTIAHGLAKSWAAKGDKVLLIDADFENRGLESALELPKAKGISDMAADYNPDRPVFQAELLQRLSNDLYFISPGIKQVRDAAGSVAFARLLKEALREVDRIVIDGPAVLENADALVLGALSDQAVFAYNALETSRDDAKEAITSLERSKTKVGGIVVTHVKKKKKS